MTTEQIEVPAHPDIARMDYLAWEAGESVPWVDAMWEAVDANEKKNGNWRDYKVNLQPAEQNGWRIVRDEIPFRCWSRIRHILTLGNMDRDTGYGDTTILIKDGTVWMSDTRAEILEHSPLINRLWWLELSPVKPSVLITGLGIGMAVRAALNHGAESIDVIEIDQDIIDLVGPNFADEPRVTIHHADAFEWVPPRGSRWTMAWHDIWPMIASDNLEGMRRLKQKFQHRVEWQECWQEAECRVMAKEEKQFQAALERGDWAEVKRLCPDF